ncbi:arabinose ABC transporter substrate-binding protein [Oxalobacteraceae bacterium OTU3CAMAD1]|nr:arabinose ABC transporter substrate-binding protein [Oxalobacteraceae bacterium OTU3CAMAD1]
MKRTLLAAASLCLMAATQFTSVAHAADPVKIGFLVKQAEEPWFQDEWRYAEQAAKDKGFTLVKIGIPNGEKMIAAIDNLAAQKAQGFVICAPDVKLGKAIERSAKRNNLKVISVDDRLVDGTGKPIASIPHMGISGYAIGKQVGEGIAAEVKNRKWNIAEVGVIRVAYDQLPTAKERTTGAIDALKAAGFPAANIVDAPQAKTDTESAFNAANIALTKNARFKHWVAVGLNDEAVLGAVRAAEGRGIKADSMVGVGIGGAKAAENELNKPAPTGFYGSVMISAKQHGYETSVNMYNWITGKGTPPAEVLTKGMLMTRANQADVRKQMGM